MAAARGEEDAAQVREDAAPGELTPHRTRAPAAPPWELALAGPEPGPRRLGELALAGPEPHPRPQGSSPRRRGRTRRAQR